MMNSTDDIDNKTQVFWAPAEIAWAAAWAAQRIHGGYRPINHNLFDDESNRLPSNKDTLLMLLADTTKITEEDRTNGALAREWFQGQLFGLISGELSDFMKRATEIATKDEISLRKDAGVISCLPHSYIRATHKENICDIMTESSSKHIGAITEKIVCTLWVLDIKDGVSFEGTLLTATDGNNFFRFCTSKIRCNVGDTIKIQGKVKRHDFDRDSKTPVTWLNYVKLLD